MKQKQSIIGYYKKNGFKALGRDLLYDILGSILYAAGIYTFAATANFAPGGITGVAMIINHYLPFLRIGLLTLLINIPVAIICYRLLGRVFFFKSLKSMLISALILDYVFPLLPQYDGANNPLLAALFAGALGNAYDRLAYGQVTDFLNLEFMSFPIFNVADCGITVGVVLLVIFMVFSKNSPFAAEKPAGAHAAEGGGARGE